MSPFVFSISLVFFSCNSPENGRLSHEGFLMIDSCQAEIGFNYLRRNSGSVTVLNKTYFFFADLESAKRLVLCDSNLREVKRIDLGWLEGEYGELAGIAPEDTSTFWVLTKYSNMLLKCTADTVLAEHEITRSGLALN